MEIFVLLFYVLAGFIDAYFKEGAKERLRQLYPNDPHSQWLKLPKVYHHENYWHVKITAIWMIPVLLLTIFEHWTFIIFIIPFYLEDYFYYVFSWLMFRQWIPEKLDWLYGDIKFYERFLEKTFKVENFTKEVFYKVLIIQFSFFLFLYMTIFW